MHFRLYNRPAAFNIRSGLGNMWIDGAYEYYEAGAPYEGRVNIHGAVGLMKVEVLDSNLPPGASVYIDQVTKQVVVKWPTYTPPVEEVKEVPNGSFEDDSYWEIVGSDAPVKIEQGWSPNNKGNLTYRDQKGEYIVRGAWAPVSSINRNINISAKVEHGKSSKGNASCAVGLAWYDAERKLVREDWGNAVTNGGKGRWYDTKLMQASSDRLIKFVRPAIKFGRKKQNHPIHAGQVVWDHVYVAGYNEEEDLSVTVRVTDSVNNSAVHFGVIEMKSNYFVSLLYPVYTIDSVGADSAPYDFRGIGAPSGQDFAFAESGVEGFELVETVRRISYKHPTEIVAVASSTVEGFTIVESARRKTITVPADSAQVTSNVDGFTIRTQPRYTSPADRMSATSNVEGFTIS